MARDSGYLLGDPQPRESQQGGTVAPNSWPSSDSPRIDHLARALCPHVKHLSNADSHVPNTLYSRIIGGIYLYGFTRVAVPHRAIGLGLQRATIRWTVEHVLPCRWMCPQICHLRLAVTADWYAVLAVIAVIEAIVRCGLADMDNRRNVTSDQELVVSLRVVTLVGE